MNSARTFIEHRIPREQGALYARDYAGSEPAFVLMHGFPDNLEIYDELVPDLVASGRRVITFDFLGFGRSDKPAGAAYSFEGQLDDLRALADQLELKTFVPVAHDSSGPAAINYTLTHPNRVASLVILNSGYDDNIPVLWPEIVTLFATSGLGRLADAIARSPEQFGWLLSWQMNRFGELQPAEQRDRFSRGVVQLIADNFAKQPSSGPAFMQLASQFFAELGRNTKRLPQLKNLDTPVKVIWGELDPYMTAEVGRDRASHFKKASFHLIKAGHWLQADAPVLVAKEMLA